MPDHTPANWCWDPMPSISGWFAVIRCTEAGLRSGAAWVQDGKAWSSGGRAVAAHAGPFQTRDQAHAWAEAHPEASITWRVEPTPKPDRPKRDPRGALYNWRYRERKAGRLPPPERPRCPACDLLHTGVKGPYCSRCWEKLTPEGREAKARRVRDSRAKAKARALERQSDNM